MNKKTSLQYKKKPQLTALSLEQQPASTVDSSPSSKTYSAPLQVLPKNDSGISNTSIYSETGTTTANLKKEKPQFFSPLHTTAYTAQDHSSALASRAKDSHQDKNSQPMARKKSSFYPLKISNKSFSSLIKASPKTSSKTSLTESDHSPENSSDPNHIQSTASLNTKQSKVQKLTNPQLRSGAINSFKYITKYVVREGEVIPEETMASYIEDRIELSSDLPIIGHKSLVPASRKGGRNTLSTDGSNASSKVSDALKLTGSERYDDESSCNSPHIVATTNPLATTNTPTSPRTRPPVSLRSMPPASPPTAMISAAVVESFSSNKNLPVLSNGHNASMAATDVAARSTTAPKLLRKRGDGNPLEKEEVLKLTKNTSYLDKTHVPEDGADPLNAFILINNAVRKEFKDLKIIMQRIKVHRLEFIKGDHLSFYAWWTTFVEFLDTSFEFDEAILFPWLNTLAKFKGILAFEERLRLREKVKVACQLVTVIQKKIESQKPSEITEKLEKAIKAVEKLYFHYAIEKETILPRFLAKLCSEEEILQLERSCLDFYFRRDNADALVPILVSWMTSRELTKWSERVIYSKNREKDLYEFNRKHFKSHVEIVDYFTNKV